MPSPPGVAAYEPDAAIPVKELIVLEHPDLRPGNYTIEVGGGDQFTRYVAKLGIAEYVVEVDCLPPTTPVVGTCSLWLESTPSQILKVAVAVRGNLRDEAELWLFTPGDPRGVRLDEDWPRQFAGSNRWYNYFLFSEWDEFLPGEYRFHVRLGAAVFELDERLGIAEYIFHADCN